MRRSSAFTIHTTVQSWIYQRICITNDILEQFFPRFFIRLYECLLLQNLPSFEKLACLMSDSFEKNCHFSQFYQHTQLIYGNIYDESKFFYLKKHLYQTSKNFTFRITTEAKTWGCKLFELLCFHGKLDNFIWGAHVKRKSYNEI